MRADRGGADAAQGPDAHGTPARRDAVVVVFARAPEPGRVKTRLASAIGEEAAADLYAAFLSDLRCTLASARCAVRWAVAPPGDGFAARLGLDPSHVLLQHGDDLGARMAATFRRMRDQGFARCVIVGSDMPQLTLATIDDALARLDEAELVLGPACDGGYYLIAAREPLDVFTGIAWGGREVLAATLDRAERLGLRVALLDESFDVDVASDLERLRKLLDEDEDARRAMPATSVVLGVARVVARPRWR